MIKNVRKQSIWRSVVLASFIAIFIVWFSIASLFNGDFLGGRYVYVRGKQRIYEKVNWSAERANLSTVLFENGNQNECLQKRHIKELPAVDVVIAIHNEQLDDILGQLERLLSETPDVLLNEVLLIDNCSSNGTALYTIEQMVQSQYPKVRFIQRPKHCGLAKIHDLAIGEAAADILVIMSNNVNVGPNWLPPLLEPIVVNENVVTQPIFYTEENVKYLFNWDLSPRTEAREFVEDKTENYENSLLKGNVIVIRKALLSELGGFEKHFVTSHEEALELSFKVWMCAGSILSVPCSHVQLHVTKPIDESVQKLIPQNLKRIADVWMDNYIPAFYEMTNAAFLPNGNVINQKSLRKSLTCKSFEWYVRTVAPELTQHFPFLPKMFRASGAIQSISLPNLCISVNQSGSNANIGLSTCAKNKKQPHTNQYFVHESSYQIRTRWESFCIQASDKLDRLTPPNSIILAKCNKHQSNQMFRFDFVRETIILVEKNLCLDTRIEHGAHQLFFGKCDLERQNQRWRWGYLNQGSADNEILKNLSDYAENKKVSFEFDLVPEVKEEDKS